MPLTRVKNHKPAKLPTPINLEPLSFLLKSYDSDLKTFLLSGFTLGFHLGSDFNKPSEMQCKNHKSALDNRVIVAEKIRKEIDKGRCKDPFEHPPFSKFTCSPLGLIPRKEEGKFRLIHDFSYPKGDSVNSVIPKEYTSVSYENIETVIHLVQQHGHNCLMAKSDIEDAFRLLPIHPDDHHLLGFTWEGKYYYDTCLPMG